MRRFKLIALGGWLIVLVVGTVSAGSDGTSAGIVLAFPVSARSLAMGNAYTVSSGDLGGAWYNPAALARLDQGHVTAFYDRRLVGDYHGGFMASYPMGGGSLGGYLMHYSTGDVDLIQTDGEIRTFTGQADYILGLSYGAMIGTSLGAGATVKVLRSTLAEEFSANSVSLDAGLVYGLLDDVFLVGASLRNLGPDLAYDAEMEDLPWSAGFGMTYRKPLGSSSLVGAMDIVKARGSDFKQHVGLEYFLRGKLALRAGYRFSHYSMGFTFGLGVHVGGLELSHGVGLVETFDNLHLTQISYRF